METSLYDFIGVTFDHTARTVAVSTKARVVASTMSAQDLLKTVGRLIFASAMVGIPLVYHYWALKFTVTFAQG